jgi:uncharacterized membrane protein YdcZ (DUF606 family)
MRVPAALALAFLCGGGVSLQAFVNGRLGTTLGSAEMAAVVSNAVGLLAPAWAWPSARLPSGS